MSIYKTYYLRYYNNRSIESTFNVHAFCDLIKPNTKDKYSKPQTYKICTYLNSNCANLGTIWLLTLTKLASKLQITIRLPALVGCAQCAYTMLHCTKARLPLPITNACLSFLTRKVNESLLDWMHLCQQVYLLS